MPGRLHDTDYAAFVEHLAAARRKAGMNQVELARRLGRPQSYVSKIERLERRLDIGEWRAMAIATGLDPAEAFAEICTLLEHMELLAPSPPRSR